MLTISHEQLETIVAFLATRPYTPRLESLLAYFKSRLVESKAIFAVTLKYPTTSVDNKDVLKLFVVEVVSKTSQEEMQAFYKKMSAVTNS